MTPLKVLVVEDNDLIRDSFVMALEDAGFAVDASENGQRALERSDLADFGVIVSDVAMPVLDGLGMLKALRDRHVAVPVVLVTGSQSANAAADAARYGALLYLTKPVNLRTLIEVVRHAGKLSGGANRARSEAPPPPPDPAALAAEELSARLDRAIARLWMAFQPIVLPTERRVIAFEALMRSDEPAMARPDLILDAAERLDRLEDLGVAVRARVAEALVDLPEGSDVFVNLHARDLLVDGFLSGAEPLTAHARRVVLEITERASLERVVDLPSLTNRLRAHGYRLAIDDLGAGYAGLTAVAHLRPEVVKIDMSLVRGLDADPVRQELVGRLNDACRRLGLRVVCEGVENAAERDALLAMGCDCHQGYLYAKPTRGFPPVAWG
ncbi:MAG: EAL domain-containing protein [Polyangiales bacterium]